MPGSVISLALFVYNLRVCKAIIALIRSFRFPIKLACPKYGFCWAVAVIAKSVGLCISANNITQAQSELSEEELEGGVGAADWFCRFLGCC